MSAFDHDMVTEISRFTCGLTSMPAIVPSDGPVRTKAFKCLQTVLSHNITGAHSNGPLQSGRPAERLAAT